VWQHVDAHASRSSMPTVTAYHAHPRTPALTPSSTVRPALQPRASSASPPWARWRPNGGFYPPAYLREGYGHPGGPALTRGRARSPGSGLCGVSTRSTFGPVLLDRDVHYAHHRDRAQDRAGRRGRVHVAVLVDAVFALGNLGRSRRYSEAIRKSSLRLMLFGGVYRAKTCSYRP